MGTAGGKRNHASPTIRLKTYLGRKPGARREYILVHEMAHLLEPTHNARFVGLRDRFLPGWEHRRDVLNRLPLRHDDWSY